MTSSDHVAFRRIVTGHDAAGRSCIAFDDPGHQHGGNVELWSTGGSGPSAEDPVAGPSRLLPPAGGTNIRYVRTRTTDYIVMLAGEVSLLLEDGERLVRPGDVVVQRGTSHAWVNRGSAPAIFVAVMMDESRPGTPVPT